MGVGLDHCSVLFGQDQHLSVDLIIAADGSRSRVETLFLTYVNSGIKSRIRHALAPDTEPIVHKSCVFQISIPQSIMEEDPSMHELFLDSSFQI